MLKIRNLLFFSVIIFVFMAISVIAKNESATNANANLATSKVTSAPVGKTAGQSRRTGADPVDDRVELREYLFTDTNEMLPYAVFVSSKVDKDKKAPLVLALHGFSGNHGTFMRSQCVEEAEKNGYILVGAMGYSPSGSFGMNFSMGGRGRRSAASTPSFGSQAPAQDTQAGTPAGPGGAMPGGRGMMTRGRGMGMSQIGGTKETDSAKVAELSEKDAMNVLEMARKEFNVDDNRIYLMGHSLGGGGALHMGEKYADIWAGVAGLAPAAFGFTWTEESKLKNVPLFITVGDADTLVTGSKQLYDQLKELDFKVEYKSMPGLDHGGIIGGSMPDVFKFFNEHSKPETNAVSAIEVSAHQPVIPWGSTIDPLAQMRESEQFAKSIAAPDSPQWQAKGDQRRNYTFHGTGATIPYRVYVPNAWDGKSKLPLVMMLHGGGSNENMYLDQNNKQLLKLAEDHGYILVSPLGYSPTGAYGTCLRLPAVFGQPEAAKQMMASLTPERVRSLELSEKDVINVLEIVLNEYPVDRSAMFLTGHSMGSGGTWYLGAKYSQYWAAIAPMSGPFVDEASYSWDNIRKMPIFMTEGTGATPSLAGSHKMQDWMKEQGFRLDYKEVNADHGGMLLLVLPDVFDFFDRCRAK